MRPKIIVFARAPQPGTVKTRLTGVLSPESAAALHSAMVTDLVSRLQRLRPVVDLEVHTNVPTSVFRFPDVRVQTQVHGDLGQRLFAAISEGLQSGRKAVLVMGSDSPTVPLAHISAILDSTADVVLGPASDGGFYAILCRRMHPEMFAGVTWSASTTCAQAADALRKCGFAVETGREWYDVDTPADLRTLAEDPNLGPATRFVLDGAGDLRF